GPEVVGGHVRELRAAGTLADPPDVGRGRLEPVVDLDVAPRIQLDTGHFESDPGGVGNAPRRDQEVASGDRLLTTGRPYSQTDACPAPSFHFEHLGRKQDLDPFAAEDPLKLRRDVRILALDELLSVRDDGHAAPEAAVRLGELEADIAAAEDDEMLGQPIDLEQLDVRERSGIRQAGDRWNRGMRSQ